MLSHIFSAPKHQPPIKKKKKTQNHVYIQRTYQNKKKIYIFPFAFPRFLTTQTPSTKQSSKHTLKKKREQRRNVSAKRCTEAT